MDSELNKEDLFNRLEVNSIKYYGNHKELILLTKFLANLTLEFESIFNRIGNMLSEIESDDLDVKELFGSDLGLLGNVQVNSNEYINLINEKEKQYISLTNDIEDSKKAFENIDPNFSNCQLLISRIESANEILQKEIIEKEVLLNQMEKELFVPLKSFSSVFSDILIYNINLESEELVQFINKTVSEVTVLLNDYSLYKDLKYNNIDVRNADFNLEELIGNIIDKYSINGSFYDINLFYKIDRSLPSNIVGDKSLFENIISLLLDISFTYILVSKNFQEADQLNRIDLNVVCLENDDGKVITRISITNSGIRFKDESKSSLVNLFSLFENDYPFGEMKIEIADKLLSSIGKSLTISNHNDIPCLTCDLSFEVF